MSRNKKDLYPLRVYKKFLNRPQYHDLAGVRVTVNVDGYGYQDAAISLSDCRKTITLDLNASNEREYTNSMYKIKTLKDALDFAEEHMVASWQVIKANKKK